MIKIENLNIKIGDQTLISKSPLIFNNTTLTFIKGKSGSGKTALLYVLGLISSQNNYQYYYNQEIINEEKKKEYIKNKKIGFVFQNLNIHNEMTILENLYFFSRLNNNLIDEKQAIELLKNVNLKLDLNTYPENLSGGEKQRLAIACVLVKNPEVIIADEPTSALDEENSHLVMNIFKRLSLEGRTVIIVTHSNNYDYLADNILTIKDNEVNSLKLVSEKNENKFQYHNIFFSLDFYLEILLNRLKKSNKKSFIVLILSMFLISLSVYFVIYGESYQKFYEDQLNQVIDNEVYLIFYGEDLNKQFTSKDIQQIAGFKGVRSIYPIKCAPNVNIEFQDGRIINNIEVYPLFPFQQNTQSINSVVVDFRLYSYLNQEIRVFNDLIDQNFRIDSAFGDNKTHFYSQSNKYKIFISNEEFSKLDSVFTGTYVCELDDFMQIETLTDKIAIMQKDYIVQSSLQNISNLIAAVEHNRIYIKVSFVALNIISFILLLIISYQIMQNKKSVLCILQANGLTRKNIFFLETIDIFIKLLISIGFVIIMIFILIKAGNLIIFNENIIKFNIGVLIFLLMLLIIDYVIPNFIMILTNIYKPIENELRALN